MINGVEQLGNGGSNSVNQPQPEITTLSNNIIGDLAGFDAWLRPRRGEQFLVDMYITKPDPETIVPIDQDTALPRIRHHISTIDTMFREPLSADWALIRANLVATVAYREEEASVARGEEKTSYDEYLMLVSGVKPRLIPWEELQENRRALVTKIRSAGFYIPYGNQLDDIKSALRSYQDRNRYNYKSEIERDFLRYTERYQTQLGDRLGEDLRQVKFEIVWKERNAFWMMWERIKLEGNYLWANWHPRQRPNWDKGTIERYAIHEPAHFNLAYLVGKEIEAGNLDPAVGIFLIPGPSCFHLEGLAQTLDDLVPLDITLDGRLSTAEYRLRNRALNNALFLAENGIAIDDVIAQVRDFMPLKSDEEIRQLVIEGTTQPFERAYLPLYGLSDFAFMQSLRQLGDGMRNLYLPQLFKRPMTRDQLMSPTLRLDP